MDSPIPFEARPTIDFSGNDLQPDTADPRDLVFDAAPTKSLTDSGDREDLDISGWVNNRYAVGGFASLIALVMILSMSPSFAVDADGHYSTGTIAVVCGVVFVASVFGPSLVAWSTKR